MLRIIKTTILWAVVWGLAGAAFAAVVTIFEPDTGHFPADFLPLYFGVPSAIFGAIAGLAIAIFMAATKSPRLLDTLGRKVVGGIVGGLAGIVFTNVWAPTLLTVLPAGFLGAVLGSRVAKFGGDAEKKEWESL